MSIITKPNNRYCSGVQPEWPKLFVTELGQDTPLKNSAYRVNWNGKISTYLRNQPTARVRAKSGKNLAAAVKAFQTN